MFFSPRARHRDLAPFCRRLGIALESGLDIRKVLKREAEGRAPLALRRRLKDVSERVSGGDTVAEALDAEGKFFPTLMRELVRVGEQTGHLDGIFRHLADHYEYQVKLRREFVSSISWPLSQLGISLAVIALVIYVSGMMNLKDLSGKELDILGLGLRGGDGVVTYFIVLGCIAAMIFGLIQAMKRGVFWLRPVQRAVMRTPMLGTALETLAISRFAWTMHMTGESGMSLKQALPLCLAATQNDRYTQHTEAMLASVRNGDTLTDTLAATDVFPDRFLEVFDVGERAGRLPETMKTLTEQYQEEARGAVKVLMQIASWLVSLTVMGIVAYFIIRIAMVYIGMIHSATKL